MNINNLRNLFLSPVEDGLTTRPSGEYVVEKYHYIRNYMQMFTTAMRNKKWRGLRFIDLFSGPGKCKIDKTGEILLGSPLIAITLNHPFDEYMFVDLDGDNIRALEQRCSSAQLTSSLQFYIGDGNKKIDQIESRIEQLDKMYIPGTWPFLNLAFLDPEGYEELSWETVSKLASLRKMDLIIHYPQSGLNRNLMQEFLKVNDTAIDRFFGDRLWRNVFEKEINRGKAPGRTHRALIDYYKEKLKKLGYVDIHMTPEPAITRGHTNVILYRLIFASKHSLGSHFWKEVNKKDVYGQKSLFD